MAYVHLLYGVVVYNLCEVISRLLYKVYTISMGIYSSMEERSVLSFSYLEISGDVGSIPARYPFATNNFISFSFPSPSLSDLMTLYVSLSSFLPPSSFHSYLLGSGSYFPVSLQRTVLWA